MNTFQQHYDRLNDEQKKAVDRTEGPLLILAGPGTGKTQLLSVRAANIIRQEKAGPENILILTFTNAAARAMRERLTQIAGHDGYSVEVETFHSFANSIVLESEGAISYVKDRIDITDIERIRALQYILDKTKGVEPLRPFGAPYIHLSETQNRISELRNEGISPEEFKRKLKALSPDGVGLEEKQLDRLKALSLVYEKYERLKDEESSVLFDERGRKDFDDMILIALEALRQETAIRDSFRRQYPYIMVDEYQDTNGAQLELLFSIMGTGSPNICCVGDDDQSIYRFQGATLANFRILKEKIPGLETIVLRDNYRSTKEIVELSRRIMAQLPGGERVEVKKLISRRDYKKKKIEFLEFLTEEEELAFIVNEISENASRIKKDASLSKEDRGKPFNNIAVLVRKRNQRQKVIEAFLKAGIPYALGDKTDSKEDIRLEKRVRQMMDVLDLANVDIENNEKKSLSLYRVLTSDYVGAAHSDILKFIGMVNVSRNPFRGKNPEKYRSFNLFQEFQTRFPADKERCPGREDSEKLKITRDLDLEDPHALHRAAWAINRLISDARTRPVHDILMTYIDDAGLYRFMLANYEDNRVLRVRDLRALVSFVNMIKQSSLSKPSFRLEDLMEELALRDVHNMPVNGELATLNQDGVRIYTAHGAKGLEFHTVFMPFCLEQKSWPVRSKPDVVPLPPEILKSKESCGEKKKTKLLDLYDELRLFYVASTRARANLIYSATPGEKVIVSRFLSNIGIDPRQASPEDEERFLAEFLNKNDERDPFRDISGILKDMVRDMTLNPTSLNNYIACGRKFLYDNVLRLPGRKNQSLIFGNCAHKALEEVYAFFKKEKKFPDFSFFSRSFKRELAFQGVNETIDNWCLVKMNNLKDWYAKESASPVIPIDLETKLEISIPKGPVFRGTFDKIESMEKGYLRVIDYKTGAPDKHIKKITNCRDISTYGCDDYYRQLIAYKLLYDRAFSGKKKGTVIRGVLRFLEPAAESVKKYELKKGAYRDEEVELTDAMAADLEKLITDRWRDIQSLKFDKLPERDDKERCRWCDYASICWN